jgi:hypothetical protein
MAVPSRQLFTSYEVKFQCREGRAVSPLEGVKMRTAMLFLLLASPAYAQTQEAVNAALFACGPANVKFEVKESQPQPESAIEPGKALVYVIEDMGQASDECFGGCITIRLGLDGDWVGANQGNTHFSFSVSPGEHHLCANWQSGFSARSSFYSLASFTAEAAKTYYFRARIWQGARIAWLDLDQVNSDQGRYLATASPLAISHARK